MRVGRFQVSDGSIHLGTFEDGVARELDVPAGTSSLEELLAADPALSTVPTSRTARTHELSTVRLLSPVSRPSKILCVGLNYPPHVEESNFDRPTEPVLFSKVPSCLIGDGDAIVLPTAAPRRVDYEAELVVVIGRRGRDIPEARALEHIAGYTVGNDVSARDWQLKKPNGQWLLGKSFDTFLPLGPWMVTADEVGNLAGRQIRCRIGAELLQDDVVGSMIFDVPTLVAYVSQVMTLEPGDLLMTGTPGGVGQSRTPPRWLQPGDLVESSVDGVGTLHNPVREPDKEAGSR
jgi:2-keto-4-pentenoate hydratase/2-oxohepta-3-ene-1,7-dioic acid hydratase in catechol pathway